VGELGLLPREFWALTYSEFAAMAAGYARAQKRRTNELVYLAWHVAALSRQTRLPELSSLLQAEDETRKREQTPDEMLTMVRMLNAAMGGVEVEVETHGDPIV
jgi:hypothetical protein